MSNKYKRDNAKKRGVNMFGNYVDFLEKSMDVSSLKRSVGADNIANINTPGFKAGSVDFDLMLDEQVLSPKKTNEKHLDINSGQGEDPRINRRSSTKERYDENNVDLNKEMTDMIKNNYNYSLSVQAINKEFALNKTALGK